MASIGPAILATPRLTLLPLDGSALDDPVVDDLHALYSDPEVMRHWSSAAFTSRRETRDYTAADLELMAAGTAAFWRILERDVERGGTRTIGKCTLIHFCEEHRRAEIGYILHRPRWGRGLATEACSALLEHAFSDLGLHRLEADTDPDNAASIALLEKLGFKREGRLRQRWRAGGEWRDSLWFGLLAGDWRQRQSPVS
jgi:RimJ/RimL family protein N-acetyltransferase